MARTIVLRHRDTEYKVDVRLDGEVRVTERTIRIRGAPDGSFRTEDAPQRTGWAASSGDVRWVFFEGRVYVLEVERQGTRRRGGRHHGSLTAPMPATVRRVNVRVGDAVATGEALIVLEAMKMELPVRAPAAGIVEAVHCREGELVQPGAVLLEIDEEMGN